MSLLLSGDDGASKVDITAFNSTGTAPQYVCRAWINFNGTGVVAIRDSGNVSSITDNGTGNYTITFTTDMNDTNYCVVDATNNTDGSAGYLDNCEVITQATSYYIARTGYYAGGVAARDQGRICLAVFR